MKNNVLKLAKELDFNLESEYYSYIIDSLINGQRQQVRKLFLELNRAGKKEFLAWINNEAYDFYFKIYIYEVKDICLDSLL